MSEAAFRWRKLYGAGLPLHQRADPGGVATISSMAKDSTLRFGAQTDEVTSLLRIVNLVRTEEATTRPEIGRLTTAAAKVVTAMSAHSVAAAGHQIHGAIGTTSEHHLGRFTTALWSGRDRFGSEQLWAEDLASRILDDGIDVWDVVTGTRTEHDSASTAYRSPA